MFRRRAEIREHLLELIEKFRQKGALSPEKALTAAELGLPPEFKEKNEKASGAVRHLRGSRWQILSFRTAVERSEGTACGKA